MIAHTILAEQYGDGTFEFSYDRVFCALVLLCALFIAMRMYEALVWSERKVFACTARCRTNPWNADKTRGCQPARESHRPGSLQAPDVQSANEEPNPWNQSASLEFRKWPSSAPSPILRRMVRISEMLCVRMTTGNRGGKLYCL
jgi:hypothetical protein